MSAVGDRRGHPGRRLELATTLSGPVLEPPITSGQGR